jgi:hypothetical protein
MSYEKAELAALADKVLQMFDAVRDGVSLDDLDEAVGLLTAFGAASDEIKQDTDAALLHVAAALLDRVGDRRLDAPA